jgi:hypothetical protein
MNDVKIKVEVEIEVEGEAKIGRLSGILQKKAQRPVADRR